MQRLQKGDRKILPLISYADGGKHTLRATIVKFFKRKLHFIVRTRTNRQKILIQNTEQPIRIKIGLTASRSIFKNKIKQKRRDPAISPGRAANSSGKNRISNAV